MSTQQSRKNLQQFNHDAVLGVQKQLRTQQDVINKRIDRGINIKISSEKYKIDRSPIMFNQDRDLYQLQATFRHSPLINSGPIKCLTNNKLYGQKKSDFFNANKPNTQQFKSNHQELSISPNSQKLNLNESDSTHNKHHLGYNSDKETTNFSTALFHWRHRIDRKFIPTLSSSPQRQPLNFKLNKKIKQKNILIENIVSNQLTIPEITARSWLIYDKVNEKIIDGKNFYKKMEVASLTKIMTFYVCYQILKRYNLDPKSVQIRISKQASDTIGTSGLLQYGDLLTIQDLYYALMLPSGNDAALAIAQGIGTIILYEEKQHHKRLKIIKVLDVEFFSAEGDYYNQDEGQHNNPIDYFLKEMNLQSTKLELNNSNFNSPHGMSNRENVSQQKNQQQLTCAFDLARLCSFCSDIEIFQEVVKCKEYQTQAKQRDNSIRMYTWKNTNKLLDKGFIGIKTGITDTAGPCLASAYKKYDSDGSLQQHMIVIVIKSNSVGLRWDETIKLIDYAIKKKSLDLQTFQLQL